MASTDNEPAVAADPPASAPPAETPATEPAAMANDDHKPAASATARPEREPKFKDYLRIFSYARKWDYVLMVGAAFASIGAGTVSPAPPNYP